MLLKGKRGAERCITAVNAVFLRMGAKRENTEIGEQKKNK